MSTFEPLVEKAKIAEKTERYEDMAKVIELDSLLEDLFSP